MADLFVQVMVGEISVTSTPKTWLTIKAPANQRLRLKSLEICGKGTSNTDTPIKIELVSVSGDSVNSTGSATLSTTDTALSGLTPQATYKTNYSSEPNYGNVMRTWELHPQVAGLLKFDPPDDIKIHAGTEIGIRITSNQTETVSLQAVVEE